MDVDALQGVLEEIKGSVNICRVRSITDPKGKASFSFELNESKYKVLGIMREKRQQAIDSPRYEGEVIAIEEDILAKQLDIKLGLVQALGNELNAIDEALHRMSQLDVIFAKAAFGLRLNARIPKVGTEMTIDVPRFIHPLLAIEHEAKPVPIDLKLTGSKNALIITGPNGGGKTLAMKGFGHAVMLCKLGIPIPVQPQEKRREHGPRPRVDLFDQVLVSIGDGQDIIQGESTFTSQISAMASIINQIRVNDKSAGYLLLIDELGSGTEASAGGAIAQAILETLCDHRESCRVVATTHSTRLKVLAHESDKFESAAVLLKPNKARWQLPTYQLQYGVIGESYPFGAASRSHPPLPEDVLARALALMDQETSIPENGESSSYSAVLSRTLQHQVDLATQARKRAEKHERGIAMIQKTMILLASAYDRNLGFLEARVEDYYQKLREDAGNNSLGILGETLGELRVVRKQVKGEKELLRERGLRLLPHDHQLQIGDSVVVVTEGEWDGTMARVASVDATQQHIAVIPSLTLISTSLAEETENEMLVFKRHQLAIWDFDSVWEDDLNREADALGSISIAESKRRLSSVLTGITPVAEATKSRNTFKSSRERKAARKQKRKSK